jgi:sirohydrochlorin cobaltochelatase
MTFSARRLGVTAALLLPLVSLGMPAAAQTGLLVVAHGASPGWNAGVRQVVAQVAWVGPVATAFLMGSEAETNGWAQGVDALVRDGAKEIVVVPLMVSSHGGHYRQIRFYAGEIDSLPMELREHSHGEISPSPVPMRVTSALDGAPELGAALLERWRSLTARHRAAPLLLVAHGPSTDAESELWVRDLESAASGIRAEGSIPVKVGLLRDDAPVPVRAAAIADIHRTALELAAQSKDSVTVLSVLISSGRLDAVTIPKDLNGLPVRYSAKPLTPLPVLARWIERVALAKPVTQP